MWSFYTGALGTRCITQLHIVIIKASSNITNSCFFVRILCFDKAPHFCHTPTVQCFFKCSSIPQTLNMFCSIMGFSGVSLSDTVQEDDSDAVTPCGPMACNRKLPVLQDYSLVEKLPTDGGADFRAFRF